MSKLRVGVFFGGRSPEHEVSLQSARGILANLDANKYDIVPIGIDKAGRFHALPDFMKSNMTSIEVDLTSQAPLPSNMSLAGHAQQDSTTGLDVVFPILHGAYGEDGAIQGLLKYLDLPYVGPDIAGSAIGIDKDIAKRLLREAGIPCSKGQTLLRHERSKYKYDALAQELGNILFVKPACLGSSVGVSKVHNAKEFDAALETAFAYDTKLLVEECIDGREIECAVLGNEYPEASVLGEIAPTKEFYSYDAKYNDPDGARTAIPAVIDEKIAHAIRQTALHTFGVLCCEGLSRVDFFLKKDGSFLVNEINTLPGFTPISMYPKLWEASGISYKTLLDKLIEFAIVRHKRNAALKSSFT